ncbi:MAG: hypothetical protein IIX57_08750 [Lachnospiraceae bacterium]|nr:hypothetical protein [Lachnospiraceae bacterium]
MNKFIGSGAADGTHEVIGEFFTLDGEYTVVAGVSLHCDSSLSLAVAAQTGEGQLAAIHLVVEIPDLEIYPHHKLFNLGRSLRYHPEFPKGANINFYEFKGKDLLYERTYERGVEDFTYACGTGTGSLVTVLTLKGLVSGNSVRVQMQGGELIIDAEKENGQIKNLYLTGPTNMVLKGTLTDDALQL